MATRQIVYTPPVIESKADPELAEQLQTLHQLIFNRLSNHFTAIQNQQNQIAALQAQVKALQGAK